MIFVYYGALSNTFGVDSKKLHLSQLLNATKKYLDQGCSVLLLGDHNLHIGNQIIKQNHPDSSPTGRLFCDMVEDLGLKIMNGLSKNPITYMSDDGTELSVIFSAAQLGHVNIIKWYQETLHFDDINPLDSTGINTPMMWAAAHQGQLNVVKYYIEALQGG